MARALARSLVLAALSIAGVARADAAAPGAPPPGPTPRSGAALVCLAAVAVCRYRRGEV